MRCLGPCTSARGYSRKKARRSKEKGFPSFFTHSPQYYHSRFDGKTGVDVADFAPGDKFTFSTWLKHTESNEEDKHRKEHIICRADDHSKYTIVASGHLVTHAYLIWSPLKKKPCYWVPKMTGRPEAKEYA